MISTINEAAVALSSSVELSILGKATVMLVIGLIVVRLAGRARASVRHLLLTATFAMVFALPLIALTAPEVKVGVPVTRASESLEKVPVTTPAVATAPPAAIIASGTTTQSAPSSGPSWMAVVRLVWIAGAIVLFLQLVIDLWRLYRIRRDALPWLERRQLVQTLAAESGIRRSVDVLLHEAIMAPLTYGISRPAIMLPQDACEWSEADLRRAIVHELEHVRRGDWAIQLAARATCVFYWFHPLVWMGFRWLSLEAERASDDAVLRSAEHTEYAEQLVLLAARLSKAHARPALGMANRSDLSTRVSALLDRGQRRGRAGLLTAASALSVASLVVLSIAPVRAVTIAQRPDKASVQASGSQTVRTQKRISTAIERALLEAAEEGDTSGIDELLSAGANVNCAIDGDGSPLIAAARDGHLAAVRLLLDHGADPNLSVPGDGNALIMAAAGGFGEVVTLLLDRGASIDQIVSGDENALIQASANGHLEVVKLLVERGADVNARAWAGNELSLVTSDATIVKLIDNQILTTKKLNVLKDGKDEDASGGDQKQGEWRTALSMARKNGHKTVVAFLLASGARE